MAIGRFLLYFSLFLASINGFSQEITIASYTDYGKCLSGLYDYKSNDTLWPAQFDYIKKHYYYWQVSRRGLIGRIGRKGEIIVPIEYEYLEFNPIEENITAKKNGKFGMLSPDLEIIVPFKYDTLIQNRTDRVIFATGGKFGVMDEKSQVLIPAQYDKIEHVSVGASTDGRPNKRYYSQNYYEVYQDTLCGIYKVNEGLIVPCLYKSIYPNYDYYENGWETIHYYQVYYPKPSDHKKRHGNEEYERIGDQEGLVNKEGKLIIGLHSTDYYVKLYQAQPDGSFKTGFAVQRTADGYFAYNLNTGEKSANYRDIQRTSAGLIACNYDKWSLLGGNMEPLKYFNKYWFNYLADYDTNFVRIEMGDIYTDFSGFNTQLEYQHHLISLSKDSYNEKENTGRVMKGLLNAASGKTIPPKYDEIMIFPYQDQFCVWALTYQDKKKKTDPKIVVYDQKFRRIEKISGIHEINFNSNDNFYMVPVTNADERIALLSSNGEPITGFDFEKLDYKTVTYNAPNRIRTPFLVLTDAKTHKKGVYDMKGAVRIPFEYDYIETRLYEVIEARRLVADKRINELFDREFNLLISDYDFGLIGAPLDSVGQPIYSKGFYNRNIRAYYLIKDSVVYCYFQGEVKPVSTNTLNYMGDFAIVDIGRMSYLIDKSGKVRHYKYEYTITPADYGFKMESRYASHHYKIDFNGQIFDEYVRDSKPLNLSRRSSSKTRKPNTDVINGYHPTTISSGLYYWKQDAMGWHLYNALKEKCLDIHFSYPLFAGKNSNVFASIGKFGVLSDEYLLQLKPEYDYIYQNQSLYFLEQSGLWGVYNVTMDSLVKPEFDEIMVEPITGRFVVFKADKLAIYDENLAVVLPFVDTTKAIDSLDLYQYFAKDHSYQRYEHNWAYETPKFDPILPPYQSDAYRLLNNRRIIELAHQYGTKNAILEIKNCGNPNYGSYKTQVPQGNHFRNRYMKSVYHFPSFANAHFYSESVDTAYYSWKVFWNQSRLDCGNTVINDSSNFEYANFKIVNNSFVPATIDDLIKTDAASQEKFRALLIAELNRTQVLGPNCVNLEEHLAEMVQHFSLTEEGIYFYMSQYSRYSDNIFLRFETLSDVLKNPNWFL